MTTMETPTCSARRCKHYLGVKGNSEKETDLYNYCTAFPDGIPDEIAYGDNPHTVPLLGQKNKIVYERKAE